MPGKVYVATESYATDVDGVPTMVHAGITRAREDHKLVTTNPHYWELVDAHVDYDTEDASAAPGKVREGSPVSKVAGAKAPEVHKRA